jgi:hypothetical protein
MPYGYPAPNAVAWPPPPAPIEPAVPAASEPPPSFGAAGQVVFWASTGTTLTAARSGYTNGSTTTDSSNLSLSPNVGFFVSRLLLIEAAVSAWRTKDPSQTNYGFSLESGLGFNIPTGQVVSLLPEFRIGGGWAKYDYSTAKDSDSFRFWGSIGMPVLFHLAPHFFLGAGPVVQLYDSKMNSSGSNTYQTVRFTLQASIGGWL